MGYVFISYSTKNQKFADKLRSYLLKDSINVWMAPYSIPPGEKYASVITKAIRHCDCFIVLLSKHSLNSEAVDSEVELATLTYKRKVIAIELESIELTDSFAFYIHNKQIITFNNTINENERITNIVKSVAPLFENKNDTVHQGLSLSRHSQAFNTAKIGEGIDFGTYEGKKLNWIILAKKHDRILLLCKNCIEKMPYNKFFVDVVWKDCSLRKWLNNNFFYNAFNETEKCLIETITNYNNNNSQYGTRAGDYTEDKVFLLSLDEISTYQKQINENSSSCWWLRSPGENNSRASCFEKDKPNHYGYIVDNKNVGVRPSIWIKNS